MKKCFLGLVVALVVGLVGGGVVFAEITISPEVDVQISKDYQGEIYGHCFNLERKARSFLLGTEIELKDLSLRLKSGVVDSELEVEDRFELRNDLGMALGADVQFNVLEVYDMLLSFVGSYDYSRTEIDEIKHIKSGHIFTNPLRNDLTTHSYEAGIKITPKYLPIAVEPYAALVCSGSKMNLSSDIFNTEIDAEADKNFGIRCGINGSPKENISVNIEGKLIDEYGIAGSLVYRF